MGVIGSQYILSAWQQMLRYHPPSCLDRNPVLSYTTCQRDTLNKLHGLVFQPTAATMFPPLLLASKPLGMASSTFCASADGDLIPFVGADGAGEDSGGGLASSRTLGLHLLRSLVVGWRASSSDGQSVFWSIRDVEGTYSSARGPRERQCRDRVQDSARG